MKRITIMMLMLMLITSTLMAQYEKERHSTNWYDGWMSCEQSACPNEKWGERHWIRYDFDDIYKLDQMVIWNYNDRKNNDRGIRDVMINYSMDGTTWEEWGIFTFDKAPKTSFYNGDLGPDFDGLQAKSLLFIVLSNYGGGDCVGIGEVKLNIDQTPGVGTQHIQKLINFDIKPNPATDHGTISINVKKLEPIKITLINTQGQRIKEWDYSPSTLESKYQLTFENINAGVYFIHIQQQNIVAYQKLTIVQ